MWVPNNQNDPSAGGRSVPFKKVVYIEKSDFREVSAIYCSPTIHYTMQDVVLTATCYIPSRKKETFLIKKKEKIYDATLTVMVVEGRRNNMRVEE